VVLTSETINFEKMESMASLQALLFVFSLIAAATLSGFVHSTIKDCTPPSSPLKIDHITLIPDPPQLGKKLIVDAEATLSRPINKGTATIIAEVYMNNTWVQLPPCTVEYF
jgi:hypothetical protein